MKIQAQNLKPRMRIKLCPGGEYIVESSKPTVSRQEVKFEGGTRMTVAQDKEFEVIAPTAWNLNQCHDHLEGRSKPGPNPWAMDRLELCGLLARETPWVKTPEADDKPTEHFRFLVIEGMNTGEIAGLDFWQEAVAETFKATKMVLTDEYRTFIRRGAHHYQTDTPITVIPGGMLPKLTGHAGNPLQHVDNTLLITVGVEWIKEEEVEDRAKSIMREDVLACQSSLVDALMGGLSFQCNEDLRDSFNFADQVENLYPDPMCWTIGQCREHLDHNGIGYPDPDLWDLDRAGLLEFYAAETGNETFLLEALGETASQAEILEAVIEAIDDEEIDGLEAWRDAVQETDPQEVYEWWLVSGWLADELSKLDVPVLRNDYGTWWGRTCSGQSIMQDGTLQAVARGLLEPGE